jgi:hypothetical protein
MIGNAAFGSHALYHNSGGGNYNSAFGTFALESNTSGDFNTATGFQALADNTIGVENTATGANALLDNTVGGFNTASGAGALERNTGSYNTGLGFSAGQNLTTGTNNVDIANFGVAGESNAIRIGRPLIHRSAYIAGIYGVGVTGTAVVVNSVGHLGVAPSSERFKDEIKPMDKASEAILALKPVTFRYKKEFDADGIPQFGLVAEDVAKVNPDLVVRDKEGKPYTVRFDQVNAMLLNEFLKEHREVQELKKQVEALTAGLQKVSAQLEASKPAPQVVNNP